MCVFMYVRVIDVHILVAASLCVQAGSSTLLQPPTMCAVSQVCGVGLHKCTWVHISLVVAVTTGEEEELLWH